MVRLPVMSQNHSLRAVDLRFSTFQFTRWAAQRVPQIGDVTSGQHYPPAPVTNIRNTSSPHWRSWLKPETRCLVPFNSFAEYAPEPNPETKKKDVVWFALDDDRPLTAFAGIWTTFNGDRGTKSKPVPGLHRSTAS